VRHEILDLDFRFGDPITAPERQLRPPKFPPFENREVGHRPHAEPGASPPFDTVNYRRKRYCANIFVEKMRMHSLFSVFAAALALLAAAFGQGNSDGRTAAQPGIPDAYEQHKQAAIRINDLAGRVHTEADATAFVSEIAILFARELPPVWEQDSVRHRISHAEYKSLSDSASLIPEQRVVDVWNEYVREIGAPDEAIVTVAEIHNMRDAEFVVAQKMWARGIQTVWTMPNVFALGPDGKVAEGCRAVEAVRVFHDLDAMFQNLRGARDRVKKGIVVSDEPKNHVEGGNSRPRTTARLEVRSDSNPVRLAEQHYLQEHGSWAYQQLLKRLFDELFLPS
jgi:hypothetical protein